MKQDFEKWEKEIASTALKPIDIPVDVTINQTNNYYQPKPPRFPHLMFNLLVFVGIPIVLYGLFMVGLLIWGLW